MDVKTRVKKEIKAYGVNENYPILAAFQLIDNILFRYEWTNELVKEICRIMIKKLKEEGS